MTLRDKIVAEIMTLVRQPPRKMEKPTIEELERILNSETTDAVNIEPDGSVSITPTVTTVGAVADKVVGLVEAEIAQPDWNYDMAVVPRSVKLGVPFFACSADGGVAVIYWQRDDAAFLVLDTKKEFVPLGWIAVPSINLRAPTRNEIIRAALASPSKTEEG